MAKYNSLTFEKKEKILQAVARGGEKKDIALEFGIAPSTLSTFIGNKDAILANGSSKVKKRNKKVDFQELDNCVLKWLNQCRQNRISISGKDLQDKASVFANSLGRPDFKCSNGWLDKFKKRHDICFRKICGESGSVPEKMCDEWKEKLKQILQKYRAEDVFNIDESGLFFKCLPDSTLCFKNEKCLGGKRSKERVTVVLLTNMTGNFFFILENTAL